MKLMRPVLLACALLTPWMTASADGLPEGPYVRVQGQGEVEAMPDLVIVQVDVSRTAPTSTQAQTQVEAIAAKVTAAARKFGIKGDDLDASGIQIQPEYDWKDGERQLRGQRVSRQFELTLRDRTQYGALIEALAAADITAIQNIRFDFSNRVELFRQAEQKAATAAREQAQNLAQSFDARLGAIYSIDANSSQPTPLPRPEMMMAARAKSDSAPVEVSKQKIEARVSAVFEIKPR